MLCCTSMSCAESSLVLLICQQICVLPLFFLLANMIKDFHDGWALSSHEERVIAPKSKTWWGCAPAKQTFAPTHDDDESWAGIRKHVFMGPLACATTPQMQDHGTRRQLYLPSVLRDLFGMNILPLIHTRAILLIKLSIAIAPKATNKTPHFSYYKHTLFSVARSLLPPMMSLINTYLFHNFMYG
jgi:hypothetical protein